MTNEHRFTVVLDPLDEGGFNALVPGLPEVTTFGATEEQALAMAGDAVRLANSYRLDHGGELPRPSRPEVRQITVPV